MINPIELKKDIAAGKDSAIALFRAGEINSTELNRELSSVVDVNITKLADDILGDYKDKAALVFTGANGREEICPHSDLDVFLLVDDSLFDGQKIPDDQPDFAEKFGQMYYALMDARFDISSLVMRTPEHCTEDVLADQETWSQMIDRRHGWGSATLYNAMENGLDTIDDDKRQAFIKHKFDEYDKRLSKQDEETKSTVDGGLKYGGRFSIVEPDVKNGYGGLRGYQTARWVAQEQCGVDGCDLEGRGIITEEDETAAQEAYDFLMTTRCHLHDIVGKEDDNLYSHVQPEIAGRMGYESVENFMKDFFKATHEISHHAKMVCSDVAEQLNIRPPGADDCELIDLHDDKITHPMQILEAFKTRVENDLALRHSTMQAIRKSGDLITDDFINDPDANRMMLGILSHKNAEQTLIRMNRTDVLPRFIPELAPIQRLVQFDPYHAFTVDDHTLAAIGNISAIARQEYVHLSPAASQIAQDLTQQDREILSVALLLHDVHKADQPEDMKSYNRDLVGKVGARLGLEGDALETTQWLAANHFLLKQTARYQDIEDPATVENFTGQIPDLQHLELLRVMTIADTLALGPGRLESHAAFRADSIYEKAKTQMMGLANNFNRQAFTLPEDYVDSQPYVRIESNAHLGADILTIITPDKPFLMENITGAIAGLESSVLNARVRTVPNGNVRAVNTFVIQNNLGQQHSDRQIEQLKSTVTQAIALDERMDNSVIKAPNDPSKNPKNKVFEVEPMVEFSNALSDDNTTVRITARDGAALLHTLTAVFNDMDLELGHASITKQGHRAVNVFQLSTRDGEQISPTSQVALREAIMEHISEDTPAPPVEPV